jgi:hypothetical protein
MEMAVKSMEMAVEVMESNEMARQGARTEIYVS